MTALAHNLPASQTDAAVLVATHAGLAAKVARRESKRAPYGVGEEDVRQAALIGLWTAARQADRVRSNFEGYAVRVMQSEISRVFGEVTGVTYGRFKNGARRATSLDAATGDDGEGVPLGTLLADEGADGVADRLTAIDALLARLPSVQRRIVRMMDIEGRSAAEAADSLGLTISRVQTLHDQAAGELERTAKMNTVRTIYQDERFAAIVRSVAEREDDDLKAVDEVRREMERAGVMSDFVSAAVITAIRRMRQVVRVSVGLSSPDAVGPDADPEVEESAADAGKSVRLAAMGLLGRTIIKSYMAEWKLPDGTPLGEATLAKVRKVAVDERTKAILKLEDAEFLRAVGDLADDDNAKVSMIATERQLQDLFNAAKKLVTYQTTPRKETAAEPAARQARQSKARRTRNPVGA